MSSSKGVLLFSFNNEAMRYDLMALECARRVTLQLNLPVVVVTDAPIKGLDCILVEAPAKNSRYYPDAKANLSFLNGARVNAYDLSPFDETLVIDTDYLLQTPTLLKGFDYPGLKLTKRAVNVGLKTMTDDMRIIGSSGIEMYWATVLYFDRSDLSKLFFQYWRKVLDNWQFYVSYFGLPNGLVRNDFAATLALYKIYGKLGIPNDIDTGLGLTLCTLPMDWVITSIDPIAVKSHTGTVAQLENIDVHVLNKKSLLGLLSNEYQQ